MEARRFEHQPQDDMHELMEMIHENLKDDHMTEAERDVLDRLYCVGSCGTALTLELDGCNVLRSALSKLKGTEIQERYVRHILDYIDDANFVEFS